MPESIPPVRDWAQEQIDTQELREATGQLGRYIAAKLDLPALRAHLLAAEILENGPRSGVVPAARAARLLKEAEGPATFIVPQAPEPNRNRFMLRNLEDDSSNPHMKRIDFTLSSCGPIRPDLVLAISAARRGMEPVPVELGATLAGAEPAGEGTRPRPSREEILEMYRELVATEGVDNLPLYERFALETLQRWGR